jgi:hypothetical protein
VIVADAITIGLTVLKTIRTVNESRRISLKISISTCILRDGTSIVHNNHTMTQVLYNRITVFLVRQFPVIYLICVH